MNNKLSYLLLAIIIFSGILLSYVLYSGPFYAYDDLTYIMFSHQLLTGTFSPVQSPYAYGFLLPLSVATSFATFGANTFASILPSIMEYLAIIVLSFLIARKLYGDNAGLISAFFVMTAPFVVGYSTRVLPDMGVGALVGISILSLVYAQESNNKLFYFLSGAFAAMTIYVKLIGLAYILALLITLFIYRFYNKKKTTVQKGTNDALIYPFVGILILGILYVAIMFAFSGTIFGSFITYGKNQMTISPSTLGKNINALFITLFGYKGYGPVSDPQIFPMGMIIFLALAGTIIGFIKKEKNIIGISIILWIVFLYLFFGTVTLTKYEFIYAAISRYSIMISIPIAIVASYALLSIYNASKPIFKNKSIYLPILIVLLIIISYIPIYDTLYNYNISISGNTRTFYQVLNYIKTESHGGNQSLITIDNGTSSFFEFLSGYNKTMNFYTLNTSNEHKIKTELSDICVPNAVNTYIVIAYDNYSKLSSTTIFDDWINTSCSLVKVGNFTDTASAQSAYNGINIYMNLYKAN